MTGESSPPLPMTIVAGYLGAGKTTLVNAILGGDHGLRITVLVNDFGEVALDDSLIRNRDGETIALANGCACCSMSGDLWEAVNRVLAMQPRPDRLVIETSGVADPEKIHRIALADPDLADAGIVTVADAANLDAPLDDPAFRPMVEQQLRSASLIVLAKSDLLESDAVEVAITRLAEIAPGCPIARSAPGLVPVKLVISAPPKTPATKAGPLRLGPVDHDEVYATWSWSGTESVDVARLEAFLGAEDCGVWRIKGIVHDRSGTWYLIHRAGAQTEMSQSGAQNGPARIVAIGPASRFRPEEIERRWRNVLSGV